MALGRPRATPSWFDNDLHFQHRQHNLPLALKVAVPLVFHNHHHFRRRWEDIHCRKNQNSVEGIVKWNVEMLEREQGTVQGVVWTGVGWIKDREEELEVNVKGVEMNWRAVPRKFDHDYLECPKKNNRVENVSFFLRNKCMLSRICKFNDV